MPTPEYTMTVGLQTVTSDRARISMSCPDCDTAVSARIGPATRADHFIATVIAAHQEQMATAPQGAPKESTDG